LLSETDVGRRGALQRSDSLYAQGDIANALYYIEDGLIKLTRTNPAGGRLILGLYGPDDLVGEECLFEGTGSAYLAEAEVLSPSIVYRVPAAAIKRVIGSHPELSAAFIGHLLEIHRRFAQKVELMCLHDVEERIVFYLEDLAKLVKPAEDDAGYPLPITQLELADLIGATRETTSTTLNQLEKRGFVKLSRRLLTVFPRQSADANAATVGA
jgi:CRP/FNR family transcriptional regulator